MIDKSDRKVQKKRRQRQLKRKGSQEDTDGSSSSLKEASLESIKSIPQLIWDGTDW